MLKDRHYTTATIYDKRGRAIAKATNSYTKTHPLQVKLAKEHGRDEQIYLHAEIAALVKLKDWSKAYRIEVERYGKHGDPLLAKPCPICSAAIERAGIKVVEHT